jgi:hypothetical protein
MASIVHDASVDTTSRLFVLHIGITDCRKFKSTIFR